jgi:hypothetical protein
MKDPVDRASEMEMTMKKTLILAAALLSLGVGSAFAGDGDPHAQPPAQVSSYSQSGPVHHIFAVSNHAQTSVYSQFGDSSARGQN